MVSMDMPLTVYEFIFLLGLIIAEAIRLPYRLRIEQDKTPRRTVKGLEILVLPILLLGVWVLPLVSALTPWLEATDFLLPTWASRGGVVFLGLALWLRWEAHSALGQQYASTLKIGGDHTLVTTGVYRYLRHPIYTAMLLTALAQPLLLHNWIAGFSGLLVFAAVYLLRLPYEEQMMVEQFGDDYSRYMEKTGRILPCINR